MDFVEKTEVMMNKQMRFCTVNNSVTENKKLTVISQSRVTIYIKSISVYFSSLADDVSLHYFSDFIIVH